MQRDEQNMPKAGLLVMALSLILPARDLTLRRKSGEHLAGWGWCVWSEHFISGEPRELLTQVWVWEVYLEYQRVFDGDSAR